MALIRLILCLLTAGTVCMAVTCPRQCTCPPASTNVICSDGDFTSIPSIRLDSADQYKALDMSYNNITHLTADSFKNMPFTEIILKNCQISSIDPNAFRGILNETTLYLDLSDNNLKTIPMAVAQLGKLKRLDVRHNPLEHPDNFTTAAMRAIGDTIEDFRFGSENTRLWPGNLNHFQQLHNLTVDQLNKNLILIPPEGFHGFETTLQRLTIKNTHLIAVPLGIAKLKHLQELHFDNNEKVGDRGILIQSFPISYPRQELTNLTLNGDSLTKIPTVIRYLRNLKHLELDNNALNFFSDSLNVGDNINVADLYLRNCSLTRIPGELSEMPILQLLDLSNNNIDSLYENDLDGLHHLKTLIISNSSLNFISDNSFNGLPNLQDFDFSHTSVTLVPRALENKCFNSLNVEGNKIDCMCETLLWLQNTSYYSSCDSHVYGECDTIYSSISDYVTNYIPQCPQYKLNHQLPPYNTSRSINLLQTQ